MARRGPHSREATEWALCCGATVPWPLRFDAAASLAVNAMADFLTLSGRLALDLRLQPLACGAPCR